MHSSFFGGIFSVLIYDNLTTAVRKVLQSKNRIELESFRKFQAYHSFDARLTNAAAGHEKGGVEGLVGFARRNYMVPAPPRRQTSRNSMPSCSSTAIAMRGTFAPCSLPAFTGAFDLPPGICSDG
jgi:transposase